MLPLIFSNLGLSLFISNNTAESNSVLAGSDHHGSNCASTLEFSLLAASQAKIDYFIIESPTSSDYSFLESLGLSFVSGSSSIPSSLECSTIRFDRVSSDTQITLQDLQISKGEYYFDRVANLVFSYTPISYSEFLPALYPSEGISILNLTISHFNCTSSCLLIGSPEGGLTIDGLIL